MENNECRECCTDTPSVVPEQQLLDEAKKNEILSKFGYQRSAPPSSDAEQGECGKTRRRTCC